MPVEWVNECLAAFLPRLESHIARIGANQLDTRNRGPYRHYIDLPMVPPFVVRPSDSLHIGVQSNRA